MGKRNQRDDDADEDGHRETSESTFLSSLQSKVVRTSDRVNRGEITYGPQTSSTTHAVTAIAPGQTDAVTNRQNPDFVGGNVGAAASDDAACAVTGPACNHTRNRAGESAAADTGATAGQNDTVETAATV